jgi:hypothetical protein
VKLCTECLDEPALEGEETCGRHTAMLARVRAATPRTRVDVVLEVDGAPLSADELRRLEAALDEALRGRWLVLTSDARRRVATVRLRS